MQSQEKTSRLIVKNLPKHIQESRLRKIFEKHGTITDLKLVKTKYIHLISFYLH